MPVCPITLDYPFACNRSSILFRHHIAPLICP
eukprot:UN10904